MYVEGLAFFHFDINELALRYLAIVENGTLSESARYTHS